MKKVLIILYYWPPSGGGGVQRWLKFCKYLPEYGWEPIVYCPEGASYPLTDPSLEKDIPEGLQVIKGKIWEPYSLFSKFSGNKKRAQQEGLFQKESKEKSFKEKLAIWVRGNFFIPDARKFWIGPSTRRLKSWLKDNPVDMIISTGTPHSLHLIARKLKKATGIPWLADFRDPWTTIEFYRDLMLTKAADRKHHRLEKAVMTESDGVVTVSWSWEQDMQKLGAKRTKVITNGWDEEDFREEPPALSEHFVLSHVGTFAADRDPLALWDALKELAAELPGFAENLRVELIGRTDPSIKRSLTERGLEANILDRGYVSHEEAIRCMQSAQALLLLINQVSFNSQGRIAGKLFEYLASQRPVLCVGPEQGDSARIVRETGGGRIAGFEDKEKLKTILKEWFALFKKGELRVGSDGYQRYSRTELSRSLGAFLDELSKG